MAEQRKLNQLSAEEERAFKLVHDDVRVNCLDSSGMNLLDQAAFKGDEQLAEALLERGADADNRAHVHGYTGLMFAALSGKPRLCELLLNAGARPQATNNMNKSASELAAFVAQHECASLINSYVTREEVDRIIHPKGADTDPQLPAAFVDYAHSLTRTHRIHPVGIALQLEQQPLARQHLQKLVFVVDRLFERQLRSKDPNEVMSVKLWLVLCALREVATFLKSREGRDKALQQFARALADWRAGEGGRICRPLLEKLLVSAALGFPYQHSMLYQALGRALQQARPGQAPSVFTLICATVFGQRFAVCAGFCSFCGHPAPGKRCAECKVIYCSERCQRLDWKSHKQVCAALARDPDASAYKKQADDDNVTYISADDTAQAPGDEHTVTEAGSVEEADQAD